ncbi:hypothetical protein CYMTET_4173 [Cymbomonas tetramitiformis]|uniref:Integrase catalytic domain-containing protein n=1 Tax=Cymbomonas tetramitiformis TaxID=36881 RepID=A0AAE0LKR9_9CHLO|nr:hypothetical protein CYMTET_4173 [Cymbomonas tetramitiformis]
MLVEQEDALDRLRLLSPGGPRGGAQGTGTGILSDGGFDGGTGDGNTGYSGSCDWDWSDLGAGHSSSSGPGSEDSHSDHSQFTSFGMPPDAASQIQLFRAAITTDSEDRRRRTRHLTALALATILAIIIQCLFLFFLDFQSLSGDGALDRGFGGVSSAALHETGSVFQTTSHLAEIMITVGGTLVHMSWWLGFTWTAHDTPPPGLVFTSSPVVSAYALSRDGDGIMVDSGATGNITGTRSRISALDTSSTIGFSTVMTGPVSRTDGTCTLHLYGREILSGEIDEYSIPGCHFKEGARTLLSTRVMLRHGFSSPDFISMTYTHLDSGRTYRIMDNQVDYLWDEPQSPHTHHFGSAAVRTRTGDSSDWQWSNSEYTKWATTHGSPKATAKLGTPAFDVSMYGDSLPVGEGNNHPALEHWSISDDCHTKQWTGQFFYGNIPFSISMIDRMLTKGNHDFLLDPHNTTYFWIVPYMPQHQIWHKTCTMEVLHIYPKGSKKIFSFSRKHTYASSHPLTPAGSDGGPDRVFIDGTPFEICILFRNRNTPVRVSPFVEFHAVMGHGSTASLLKLYDLPGIQLGRPLLSRRAIAAMPTCSQFCAVCCTCKLKQKPCGHHDQLRSVTIQPGQKWAADMTGPITPAGYNGHLYRCQFIDYVSRFIFVYTFVQKSEYYTCLVHFYGSLHAMGYAPQSITLRTDCAPEMGDPQCVAFYQKHRILHQKSSPTVHTDNPHAENAIGKISDMAKALLLAAGMPEDYWPLAATHAGFIWNLSTHKNISTTPFHQIRGYHYGYAKLKAFGQNCYVIMSQQQRNSRQPGIMSRKSQRAAWSGRLVGVSVSSLAYKILDTETNMIQYVGKPHWIHNHQDMGEILGSFPDPHQAEREFDASYDRPQTFSDSFDTAGSRIHGIGSFFDGEESHACVQLIQTNGTVTWTMAVRYVSQTSDGQHCRDLLHYLDCYRKLNGINEHYPIWTIVKARQSIRASIYSALLISTHSGNRRPYSVILEPCPDEPAGWHIDLPANLIIFPSTHSAAYLPFSDSLSSDLRAEYMFGSSSSMEQFLTDAPTSTIIHMVEVSAPEIKLPHGVKQALSSPQSDDWLKAMDQEVGDMVNQEKLKLGTPPADAQYLTTLFVLSMPFKPDPTGAGKPYQIFEARMAGDGYLPWETSSATPEISAFRLLFIFAALFQLVVSHLDVSQAFMHAKLEFPVWIQFPSGYTFKGYSYALLSYALYGLKIAGASWQRMVKQFMLSFKYMGHSFRQSTHDACIYFIYTPTVKAMCVVYVDDFGMACSTALERAFWTAFRATFKAKHLGPISSILQMTVQHDDQGVYLNQSRQIKDLMTANNIPERLFRTPMDSKLVITKPADPDLTLVKPYRSILGSLLWHSRTSRPDIYYAVIYLSQFVACPSEDSMKALIRIAQYLDCTAHYRMAFYYPDRPARVLTLFVYSDADLARDLENSARSYSGMVIFFCGTLLQVYSDVDHARDKLNGRLSYSGGIVFLNGMVLHWVCARQTDAEMSSTGSEYVVASVVGQRAMSAIHMIVEMFGFIRITQQEPGVSALALSTAFPAADISWMQRAATFFENHAVGHGQMGPASPLHYREAAPVPDSSLYALPHAVPVSFDGAGYEDGPREYHSQRSGMYGTSGPFIPRLELPVAVMIDNQAASSILRNVMLSTKVKHVLIRFHCFRGWVCAGYLVPVYINTLLNLADIFTKPLPGLKDKVRVIISMIESFMDVIRPRPSGAGDS